MKEVILFTAPACQACAQVKKELKGYLDTDLLRFEVLELSTETRDEFLKFDVQTVPMIIGLDENGGELNRFPGYYGKLVLKERLEQWGVLRDPRSAA